MIYRDKKQWEEAEELFTEVIQTRKRVQGSDHEDTLSSIAKLALTYRDQGSLKKAEKLKMMTDILKRKGDETYIIEEVAV